MPDALDQQLDVYLDSSINSLNSAVSASPAASGNGQGHARHSRAALIRHTIVFQRVLQCPCAPTRANSARIPRLRTIERAVGTRTGKCAARRGRDRGRQRGNNVDERRHAPPAPGRRGHERHSGVAAVRVSARPGTHCMGKQPGIARCTPRRTTRAAYRGACSSYIMPPATSRTGSGQSRPSGADADKPTDQTTYEAALEPGEGKQEGKPHLLLTVQNVSDIVMNERQLATTVRASQQARRDAEALGDLAQLVNRSLTAGDLLRIPSFTRPPRYFDTPHAAVLLLAEDGQAVYEVGYSHRSVGNPARRVLPVTRMFPVTTTQPSRRLRAAESALGGSKPSRRGKPLSRSYPESRRGYKPRFSPGAGRPCHADYQSHSAKRAGRMAWSRSIFSRKRAKCASDSISLLSAFADQTSVGLLKADLYEQIATQRGQLQSIFDNAPVEHPVFRHAGVLPSPRMPPPAAITAAKAAIPLIKTPAMLRAQRQAAGAIRAQAKRARIFSSGGMARHYCRTCPRRCLRPRLRGKPFHASHVVSARVDRPRCGLRRVACAGAPKRARSTGRAAADV